MAEVGTSLGSQRSSSTGATANTRSAQTPSQDRTLRCRNELKYLVSPSQAAMVERFIQPYMALDQYSRLQSDGYYYIVSLYLDSPDLQLCRETLTAKLNRFKLRIRGYTDDPDYPLFVEIKRRLNTGILKARARIDRSDLGRVLSYRRVQIPQYQDALDQFQLYMASLGARPTALIRYLRKAYEARSEERLRVTLDKQLCFKITDQPIVCLSGPGWQDAYLTMNALILEIKFTGLFPDWLTDMVRAIDLQSQGISKYASCMVQAGQMGYAGLVVREV
ncbi:MAG: polyphosphate polymerase domain-containing protein [Sedimentisphaerales bacterium]|nr:polyphosphate polymerase domain-containing protein [Sedimentisphaerales bacterium]